MVDTIDWLEEEIAKDEQKASSGGPGGFMDYATWGTRGANVGFADVMGMPVDLTASGLRALGLDIPPEPVLGSASIRRGMDVISETVGGGPATYGSIEDVPPAYRPVARGGEVVGGSMPFIMGPYAAAVRPVQPAALSTKPGLMEPVVAAARDYPITFGTLEGISTAGAATGAGLAETIFPGETGPRVVGEVAGGVLAPGAVLGRAIMQAPAVMNRIRQLTGKSGKEYKAGEAMRGALVEAGESPEAVTRSLEGPTAIPGLQYPSAAKAGSPTLAALEDNIIKKMPEVGNNVREQMKQATQTLNQAYRMAVESGNPQAIREASKARQDWFRDMLQARAEMAAGRVEIATEGMVSQGAREQANVRAREALEESLSDARAVEERIWLTVPRNIEVVPSGTMRSYRTIQSQRLPADVFPPQIENTLIDFAEREARGEAISFGELQELRSLALEEARIARANMKFKRAARLDTLASGRDMVDGTKIPGILDDIGGLSEEARSYSRALNEVFTQGKVGEILGTNRQGGERIPPALTLERTVRRGGPEGAVAGQQIEDAAAFAGRTTMPEQETLLRDMATQALDPTGTVNPNKLARFQLDNRELLERFPGLRSEIGSVEQAQRLADQVANRSESIKKAVERSVFAKAAGVEDPARFLRSSFTGNTPLADYRQMATTARRAGPEAVAGLRGATFDMLFDLSKTGDLTSGKAMRELLTRQSGSGGNLVDTMQQSGILTERQRENLFRVVNEVERIEDLLQSGKQMDEILENASILEDLAARIVGANLGAASGLAQMSGSGLVLAHAGSQRMRQLINDLPFEKTQAIIGEAVQNPEYMATLLRKPKDMAEKERLYRQMNAFLMQAPERDETETYVGP